MYIKTVILEGFKSYGKRTEIHGFDAEFNAITGLNGTGKSNILDSICFVLGITNLGQVRATSLQDLVYKGGQAGIIKATVTLIFDNHNKKQCPIGFEHSDEISVTRQVVVGGKNKYLINGKTVQNKRVQDLFCSVQLNVNNPNFLIMQGRITKVLNMKPQEILSMIEEAAGTSMYQAKRENTTKLIEKKDFKLREMDTLLNEEIEPKLEKLRKERSHYLEYQKICRDIEFLTRIYISHKYLQFKDGIKHSEKEIENLNGNIENNKKRIKDNENESLKLEAEAKEMEKTIDEQSGGDLTEMEDHLAEISKKEAASSGKRNAITDKINAEEKKLKTLTKSIQDDEQILLNKESEMNTAGNVFTKLKEADEADNKAFEMAQKRFEAVTAGLSTNEDGEASSLQDQLMNAKQQVSESITTIKQCEMELKHSQQLFNDKQNEKQSNDSAYTTDKKAFDMTESQIKRLEQELSKINYTDGTIEELEERKTSLNNELRRLRSNLDQRGAHRFDFDYRDPEPGFDRRRVKGRVCKLFDIYDRKFCLALGMCAGGSLYSVVTDTDVTSKQILQKGDLQSRTTIIPLNKISGRCVNPSVVKIAEDIAGRENVAHALSLIKYDKELEPVMRFVFGTTFICKDMNVAKQVTYHKNIMCRSVTLDGDVVDPEGSLTGGSRPKGGAVLLEIAEIKEVQNAFNQKQQDLQSVCAEISKIERTAHQFNQLKEQLELKQHELKTIGQRLAQTSFQQHQTEIEELKEKIVSLKEKLIQAKQSQQDGNRKVKNTEEKLKDSKGHRERDLKEAEDNMKRMKKKSEESRKNWKKREQEFEVLRLEIEELKKGITVAKEQSVKLSDALVEMKNEFEELSTSNKDVAQEVANLKEKIKAQKHKINSQNKELKAKYHRKDVLLKQNEDLKLEIKKQENAINKVKNDNKDSYNKVSGLEEKYPWILEDRDYFGAKNTKYDYSKEEPENAGRKLKKMQDEKEKMSRNINQKAMMLLEREEEQYKEVMRRKTIVEEDKKKIENIIIGLDEKKKQEVKRAWKEVDSNFSGIFSTILPGAQAKLEPASGDVMKGLQVKVGFNGLWKESLTELSGGQRSLVALSLILAMLKYKPAPLYILDEVDAALDLSHTQNIGTMLKAHFRNSQFIIVSLKDGMFNNANVLFRTKFIDGMSGVTRTVNVNAKK